MSMQPTTEQKLQESGQYISHLQARLRKIEDLFAGGPDTVCRTTWRSEVYPHDVECVEVPMDDLRDALWGDQ